MNLKRDRRASVAVIAAIMSSAMVMVMSMAVEVTYWSVNQVELQRIADAAAIAAATNYLNAASPSSTTATGVASTVAQLNGIASANVTAKKASAGIKHATDTAFSVTVSRSINKTFSVIFANQTSSTVTISATAIAEIVPPSTQPCVLALLAASPSGTAQGSAKNGITLGGSATITAKSCSVISNAQIDADAGGNIVVTDAATYSSVQPWVDSGDPVSKAFPGGVTTLTSTVTDPYANDSTIQNAFNNLSTKSPGSAITTSGSYAPGSYSGIALSAYKTVVNLSPGTYYVNGDITLFNTSTIECTSCSSVNGVTFITSGGLDVESGSNVDVNGPGLGAAQGIPGLVFASKSSPSSTDAYSGIATIGNGSAGPWGGLFYFPNGTIDLNGGTPSKETCNEYIASQFNIYGSSTIQATCSGKGLDPIGGIPGSTVALVE